MGIDLNEVHRLVPAHMVTTGDKLPTLFFTSDKAFKKRRITRVKNTGPLGKPDGGLWLSLFDSSKNMTYWEDFARNTIRRNKGFKYRHKISVDKDTRFLVINNHADFNAIPDDLITVENTLDWVKLSNSFDGVYFTRSGERANNDRLSARHGNSVFAYLRNISVDPDSYDDKRPAWVPEPSIMNRHAGPIDVPSVFLFKNCADKLFVDSVDKLKLDSISYYRRIKTY